jgi:hypothetical protein
MRFVLLFLLFSYCSEKAKPVDESEVYKIKGLAFSQCINEVYPGFEDRYNDGSASGFFQTSNVSIDDLPKIDSLATRHSKKEFLSATKSNLGLMRCLELYNSQELEEFAIKVSKN